MTLKGPSDVKRNRISVSSNELAAIGYIERESILPLVVRAKSPGVDITHWYSDNAVLVRNGLSKFGAVLFRGFEIECLGEFQKFVAVSSGELLEYYERSSPRRKITGKIYTSTEYPATRPIFLHNENSYQHQFPSKIYFFCQSPPQAGGETPIADCRSVYKSIDPAIREKFINKGVMYVRNFYKGLNPSWQTVFQTQEKLVVEAYCHNANIAVEWKADDSLRISQIRPAVIDHPQTSEKVWFNHAVFFHASSVEVSARTQLGQILNEEDLPSNTFYGDGSIIEPSVVSRIRSIYLQNKVSFTWEKNDILMLDNISVAHGREPFVGRREIMVAMTEPTKHLNVKED